ncbi:MAG: hypothetical protein IJJ72_00590 [Bacteroidales bacterium]|nr:hypothetical protein [Bacteroidales bacterium]
MKRFTEVVLMLCIALMCTTSLEAQGQNRRSGGGSSHSPRTEHRAPSGHSGPGTKMSAPRSNSRSPQVSRSHGASQINRSAQVSRSRAPQVSRSQSAPRVNRSQSAPQVNRNHSGSVARSNRPAVRSNGMPSQRPNVNRAPRNNGPRPGSGRVDIGRSPRPSHRGPAFSRPYLEPRYRPMPSYHRGYHYFGHRIHTLPIGYSLIRVGYRDYYYYDGIYYRPYLGGGYYICRPPLGTRIAEAMFDMAMTAIAINTIRNEIERAQAAAELSRFYAARNADYVVRTSDDYYNVNLASQAGQNYYYQDGVFYTLRNGEYCVIEAPIGALIDEIPEDYDEVELGGKTYYQVEDTLFKPTIIDGKLRFEVACNL